MQALLPAEQQEIDEALLPAEQQEIDDASRSSLKNHHHISDSRNTPINVYAFVLNNREDPVKKVNIF